MFCYGFFGRPCIVGKLSLKIYLTNINQIIFLKENTLYEQTNKINSMLQIVNMLTFVPLVRLVVVPQNEKAFY